MLGSVTVLEHRGDGKVICSSCGLVRGRPNAGGPEREMAASLFNQVLVDVHTRHGGSIEVEGLRGQYQKGQNINGLGIGRGIPTRPTHLPSWTVTAPALQPMSPTLLALKRSGIRASSRHKRGSLTCGEEGEPGKWRATPWYPGGMECALVSGRALKQGLIIPTIIAVTDSVLQMK